MPCTEITINGQQQNTMNKFTYSTLSRNAFNDDANTRLTEVIVIWGKLEKNIWNRRWVTFKRNTMAYWALVLPSLLYGCEKWTVYKLHARKMKHFHAIYLGRLLSLQWQDKILRHWGNPSYLSNQRLHHSGAITALIGSLMNMHANNRLPEKILQESSNKTLSGSPEKAFQRHLKSFTKSLRHLPHDTEARGSKQRQVIISYVHGQVSLWC